MGYDTGREHNKVQRKFNHWWTVAAGFFSNATGSGSVMVYAYGILILSLVTEFGWERESIASNLTMFLIGTGLGMLALGSLIRRFGIRAPSAIFAASFGALFASIAIMPANQSLFHLLFFLIGIASAGCTALPYSISIIGFINSRRGLALGIVVAGAGVGSVIFPQLARVLVENWGARPGFAVIGATAAIVTTIGLLFFAPTPQGVIRRAEDSRAGVGESLRGVFNRDFWMISVPVLCVSIVTYGAMTTLVPLLTDRGMSSVSIAGVLSIAALCSLIGRLLVGYLLDRFFAPYVSAAIFVLAGIGLAVLLTTTSFPVACASAALVALAMGSEAELIIFLVSRYFPLGETSRVISIMWVLWAWGGGVGTFITGRSFTLTSSYAAAYLAFIVMLLASAVVLARMPAYRYSADSER